MVQLLPLTGNIHQVQGKALQSNFPWGQRRRAPLEEGMATHSSILAWRIPGTEEPDGLQSMGSQRLSMDVEKEALSEPCSDSIGYPDHLFTRNLNICSYPFFSP